MLSFVSLVLTPQPLINRHHLNKRAELITVSGRTVRPSSRPHSTVGHMGRKKSRGFSCSSLILSFKLVASADKVRLPCFLCHAPFVAAFPRTPHAGRLQIKTSPLLFLREPIWGFPSPDDRSGDEVRSWGHHGMLSLIIDYSAYFWMNNEFSFKLTVQ